MRVCGVTEWWPGKWHDSDYSGEIYLEIRDRLRWGGVYPWLEPGFNLGMETGFSVLCLTLLQIFAGCCPSRSTWAFCKLLVYCCYSQMARLSDFVVFYGRCKHCNHCKSNPFAVSHFPQSLKTLYKSVQVHRKCVPIVTSKKEKKHLCTFGIMKFKGRSLNWGQSCTFQPWVCTCRGKCEYKRACFYSFSRPWQKSEHYSSLYSSKVHSSLICNLSLNLEVIKVTKQLWNIST